MNDFKEHYEQMDTEQLLDIARKDLTEEARAILNDVLAHRGVAAGVINAAQEDALQNAAAQIESGNRLASALSRFFAYLIDFWGVGAALSLILFPLRYISVELYFNVVMIPFFAYFLLRDCIPGQSIGKRTLGIRVVQLESGLPCTWGKSVGRNVTHALSWIDVLPMLGQRNMRLGDVIARTIVVKSDETEAR